ncbi:MAG TPA: hypothetical protein VL135_16975 [Terracidiphilus sp.]|jgi:hypothetical protein|nr:hypothetical protein [Terracidiphilus sp.]
MELLRLSVIAAVISTGAGAPGQQVKNFPLTDAKGMEAHGVKFLPATYQGREATLVTTLSNEDKAGFALLPGTDLQDGTIEVDLAVKILTPPGMRMPGFTGVMFRAKPDGSAYELFYLRPKNALAENQSMRNHAVQYSAEPGYGWYKLRREWPFVYESYAEIEPEKWTHLKIDVAGRVARLYLNGSTKPSLVVDGLKGANLHGAIGLWVYPLEESYFSNLKITQATTAAAIKNGSDASGTWDVKAGTDAIAFGTSLKLTRDGNKLSGTMEMEPGKTVSLTGTWRDGYVELSFPFEWPQGMSDGTPGPTTAFMDGWIDGDDAKGRIRVEGRADGMWSATRKRESAKGN